MPLTLADMAVLEERKLRRGIIAALAKVSPLASAIPFENAGALNVTVVEMEELVTPSHRLLNADSTEATGKVGQRIHGLKILSNYFDIDRQLLDEPNMVQDPRTVQTQMYTRAVSYQLANLFINGDAATNVTEPNGLAWYFTNDPRLANQDIDGSGVGKINPLIANDAVRAKLLDTIEDAFSRMDGGQPDAIITNRQIINAISSAARNLKLLDVTRDAFDRQIRTYMGIPLIDAGVKPAGARLREASNQVITCGSTTDGAIYFVKWGAEYLLGIQKKPLEVVNLGISNAAPTKFRVFFEWAYNPVCIFNHYGVCRIKTLDAYSTS